MFRSREWVTEFYDPSSRGNEEKKKKKKKKKEKETRKAHGDGKGNQRQIVRVARPPSVGAKRNVEDHHDHEPGYSTPGGEALVPTKKRKRKQVRSVDGSRKKSRLERARLRR
jgi:hypothetical protein